MLNFSSLPQSTFIGRALRLPLQCIPSSAELNILQGPLRGKKWVAGSSVHGCWLGSFELSKQKKLVELVRPGMTCYDLGANVGFYTLLFSDRVGPNGSVVAFEPLPANCERLRYHLRINKCQNVQLEEVAVSNFDGPGKFHRSKSSCMGTLSETGDLKVFCCKLDTLVSAQRLPRPNVLKLDVEGAEQAVLEGGIDTLRENMPIILVATHSSQQHDACCQFLRRLGYRVQGVDGSSPDATDELLALPQSAL